MFKGPVMADIVILGAGVGAIFVALNLKELLREDETITIVSDTSTVNFNPGNHWLAMDVYKPDEINVDIHTFMANLDIKFIQKNASKIFPKDQYIELTDNDKLNYDLLVIATGPKPAFEAIPGFGPDRFTQSICSVEDSGKTGEAWEKFVKNPGPIVIGAVQRASNVNAAYEYAMIVDADLRKRGIREQAPITFVTPEPYIGYRVQDGNIQVRELLEKEFKDHGIDWITNIEVERIDQNKLYIAEISLEGKIKQRRELYFKHCMLMPEYIGVDALQGIEGLVNTAGFVIVDEHLQNPHFPNVYAVGVCVEVPAFDSTPAPVHVAASKPGFMIENMAKVAAENIRAQLDGEMPNKIADWSVKPNQKMSDSNDFDQKWIQALGGTFAPNLWQQLAEVEKKID